jgi:beta-mannosidase
MKRSFFLFILFIPVFLWSQSIIDKEITDWEFRMVGDSIWKPAKVPGTIIDNYVDLSDISNPLHPYYGDNEKIYQWIGENDWEFKTSIQIEKDLLDKGFTYDLYFNCLDLFADIYLNDTMYVSNNAFVPFFIRDLTYRNLNIRIIFHSTINSAQKLRQSNVIKLPGEEKVYTRTAQYQFGWDWGPRFVNMGIRKRVTLILAPPNNTEIIPFNFRDTNIGKTNGKLMFDVGVNSELDSLDIHLTTFLNGKPDKTRTIKYEKTVTSSHLITLINPQLWWPNTFSKKSNYYEFDIKVTLPGDTTKIAHKHAYYAVCDIQLVQEKDEHGESFYFKVNGEKIYTKGANYIPDDSFHPGKNTKELVSLAREANMNMLRVWGGGTYPDDEFYIECMKNGIMVWQDFMFACAMYPGDDFLNNSAMEVSTQVERLKEFNNIAVWCGNNENEEGWRNWGWQRDLNIHGEDSVKMWKHYDILFNKIIPETIKTANQLYGSHFNYISTSPKHGWGRKESMTDGDSHYWGVWWGLEPVEKYNEKVPRFMSEFGMQGMPDLSTLKKVIPDSAMNFDSPKFKNHQKHPTGFKTLDHYLKEYLVIPDNMEDYAYATQILQAYALTIAIEAQRRAMPYCMGSLIWQLNDCWPVTSWSLIDSELKTKIAYDVVKESFESVIISVKEEENRYDIYIINDSLKSFQENLSLCISDFDGNVLWKKKINVNVKKQSSAVYFSLNKKLLNNFKLESLFMQLHLGEKVYTNYHFKELNQLALIIPKFKIEKEKNSFYSIQTDVYAPYVWVEGFGYRGHLDPNTKLMMLVTKENQHYMDSLIADPSKIKCLNNLLKK